MIAEQDEGEIEHYELEFGASLAELEIGVDTQQTKVSIEDGDDSSLLLTSASCLLMELRESICSDIIGDKTTFSSPFALPASSTSCSSIQVPLIYCDHTASNRSLKSIEAYLEDQCLPVYGNTHTLTSYTGSQSTSFVAEARQIVAECVNAKITGKASSDVVMFTGSGATCAVELLIDCLGLKTIISSSSRPVVFVGPFEHHSNLIPWRESGCEVVPVPIHPETGDVDLIDLERLVANPLYGYDTADGASSTRLRMGTFSAASNVTGRTSNVNAITALLHKYNVLSFWDYATGASYLPIDMNPPTQILTNGATISSSELSKDAVFLSTHKMLGGPGAPGILIVKKRLVSQVRAPCRSGGGTVFYVSHDHHRFLSNRVERYEGGSPNVPGIIRAGLSFLYKRRIQKLLIQRIGCEDAATNGTHHNSMQNRHSMTDNKICNTFSPLSAIEFSTWEKAVGILSETAPNIVILGTSTSHPRIKTTDTIKQQEPNLPIFSFLVKCGSRFLHYNFVCALLNDLFGIQSRGGCQCAGPYAQYLLGLAESSTDTKLYDSTTSSCDYLLIANESNRRIENALLEKIELLRIGFTRLSIPFFMREEEFQYVLKALAWISEHGWKFLYQYRCNHRTGEWRHFSRQGRPLGANRKWLSTFDPPFGSTGTIRTGEHSRSIDIYRNDAVDDWNDILQKALANANDVLEQVLLDQKSILQVMNATNDGDDILPQSVEDLRWYIYPKECAKMLREKTQPNGTWTTISGAIQPLECCPLRRHIGSSSAENRDVAAFNEPKNAMLRSKSLTKPNAALTTFDTKRIARDSASWGRSQCVSGACTLLKENDERGDISRIMSSSFGVCVKPPAKMMRLITQAILQWNMIEDGDNLLLGLSGGKDSLSLLHCLMELQRRLPIQFSLQICTIDPMTESFDPSPLIPYIDSLGLQYHYIKADIVSRAATCGKDGQVVSSLCAFCARMKRGHLYQCARDNACNKLVLGQHLDDLAESFFMSVVRICRMAWQINFFSLLLLN